MRDPPPPPRVSVAAPVRDFCGLAVGDSAALAVPTPAALVDGAPAVGERPEEGECSPKVALANPDDVKVPPPALPLDDAHGVRDGEALREAAIEAVSVGRVGNDVPLPASTLAVAAPLPLRFGDSVVEGVAHCEAPPEGVGAPPDAESAPLALAPRDTLPLCDAERLPPADEEAETDIDMHREDAGEKVALELRVGEGVGAGERLPRGDCEPTPLAERDANEALPLPLGTALLLRDARGEGESAALRVMKALCVLHLSDGEGDGVPPVEALPEPLSLPEGGAEAPALREEWALIVALSVLRGETLPLGDAAPLTDAWGEGEGGALPAAEGEGGNVAVGAAVRGADDEGDAVPPA